jgi:gas vesicle protein
MRGCYSIALKVLYENRLSTAKQLNLAEKSWYKLARLLSLLLYDTDTKDLKQLTDFVETWKSMLGEVRTDVHNKEDQTLKSIEELKSALKQLRSMLEADTL